MLQYLRIIPYAIVAGAQRVGSLFSGRTPSPTAEAGATWKQWAKAAAAVVILASAVVVYAWRSSANESITARWDYNTRLQCLACRHEFVANLDVGDEPPHMCTKCKKDAAWRMRRCNNCGNTFCPVPTGDPPRQPIIPVCPQCNSGSTGAAPLQPK